MNDWNIQSRAHTCQGCSQQFSDQQPYHTVLFDLKREIQRLDLCEACWKGDHAEGARDRKGFISHWQGVFEVPPAAPPEAIRKENAETLLRKIMELNDPQYATASYILAAKLERQRVLKVKEQFQRDGRRYFLYEHAKTADVFTIPDPCLQLNQLEQVQREVAALLDHGFNPPATAATATAADETSGTVADHSENESEPGSGPLETNAPEPEPLSR